MLLPYDTAVSPPAIYPIGVKNIHPHKPCTHMSIAPLFIFSKTWKQPRCPSVGVWISKLVHSDNGILFSPQKKWAIEPWINMEKSNTYY